MSTHLSEWTIEFQGCFEKDVDCNCGVFRVRRLDEPEQRVEVLTTVQIERMLAKFMGKDALDDQERSLLLATAGRRLIEDCIHREGNVQPLLYLTGEIFRSRGAERRLLQESGLIKG